MTHESEDWGGILLERIKFFGAVFLCLFIDGLFLLTGLGFHWALGKGERWFAPVGVERLTSILLRVVLEVPTLLLIVIFIIVDMKRISLRIFHGAAKALTQEED